MARRKFQNEFSWSISRAREFDECKRRYWFNRYGYWNGWSSGGRASRLYYMKKLQNRWGWRGNLVHSAVEYLLNEAQARKITDIDAELKIAWQETLYKLKDQFDESKTFRFREDPKHAFGLKEHEYHENISKDQWIKVRDEVKASIFGLKKLPIFNWLIENPDNIMTIERMETVKIFGFTSYFIVDVLAKDGEKRMIIDWKTSSSMGGDKVDLQLGFYGHCLSTFDMDTSQIEVIEANPLLGQERRRPVTPESMEKVKEYFTKSTQEMFSFLENKDPDLNEALSEDVFLPGGIESGVCKFCPFIGECEAGMSGKSGQGGIFPGQS